VVGSIVNLNAVRAHVDKMYNVCIPMLLLYCPSVQTCEDIIVLALPLCPPSNVVAQCSPGAPMGCRYWWNRNRGYYGPSDSVSHGTWAALLTGLALCVILL
jgi:hypothetical protein